MRLKTMSSAPNVDEAASASDPSPHPSTPASGQDVDGLDCELADPSQPDSKMLDTFSDEDHAEMGRPVRDAKPLGHV